MRVSFNRSPVVRKPATPALETAMAAAFLRALVRVVGAGTHHSEDKIVLPTGSADIGEIKLVLCALDLIRNDRRTSQ